MKKKLVGKPIVQKNFTENIIINGHTYNIFTDNRTKSSRIDVHYYKIGDLHKPWYFYGDRNNRVMANHDTNNYCLVYDIKDCIIDLNKTKIGFTSFGYTSKSKGYDKLLDIFKKEEQRELIICEKHFSKNANNLKFKKNFFQKNSELDDLRVFEGHHRVVALTKLKKKVHARIYYSYNIDGPNIDISKHFKSLYTADLWDVSKDKFNKHATQPLFKLSHFNDFVSTPKYEILIKCINFVLSLNIKLNNGVDINCAEGAYTYLFSKKLKINKMTGVNHEPARTIRGYLAKYYHNLKNIDFRTETLSNFNFDHFDFISCLSATHFLNQPIKILEKICKNKKIIILENHENDFIDHKFTKLLADKINMSYKHIDYKEKSHYYVLYSPIN